MLQKGLNADIGAQRQDEAEARRQASIEKRWAKQDANQARLEEKQDIRFAEQKATEEQRYQEGKTERAERNKVNDARDNRRIQNQEDQKALSIYNSYEKEARKAITKIETATEKEIKELLDMGQTEQARQVQAKADARILGIQQQYAKAAKPYRNKLVASGYLTNELPENTDDKKVPPPSITKPEPEKTVTEPPRNKVEQDNFSIINKPSMQEITPLPFTESGGLDLGLLAEQPRIRQNELNMQKAAINRHQKSNIRGDQSMTDSLYRRY